MAKCFLCEEQAEVTHGSDYFDVRCRICGRYRITGSALHLLQETFHKEARQLASWTFHETRHGTSPTINGETLRWIREYPKPDTRRRAEQYLGAVIELLGGRLSGNFVPTEPLLKIASWSAKDADAVALADYLIGLGAIQPHSSQERFLLAKGHMIFEELGAQRAATSQVFVAMAFAPLLLPAFTDGLQRAITQAGYDALRIDRSEHDQKIDDRIVAEIRRSAFVVADFTEHRGGVYYESGFAHGLGKRVIFTCRQDQLANLHFDVRQYNTIPWENPVDIVKPLQNRILAIFGAGPMRRDAAPI
jgi:hypothetical protein